MENFFIPALCFALLGSLANGQVLILTANNVSVPYKDTAVLSCTAMINTTAVDSDEKVNITIGSIQRSPPLDRNTLNYSLNADVNTQTINLTLDNVMLSDEGLFHCSATVIGTNYEESQTAFFFLEIVNYYKLIQSVSAPNISVSLNNPATLACSVEANETALSTFNSQVSISIEKIDNTVGISEHTEENISQFVKVIHISSAQPQDFSLYQCTVVIGEEETTTNFLLKRNEISTTQQPSMTTQSTSSSSSAPSSTLISSPVHSTTPETDSPGSINEQLVFALIIAAVVVVTIVILFAVACYFIAANLDICFNKDEMRMNKMDKKTKRKMKKENTTSLYNQELGPYALNDAYNVDLDEDEMEDILEERDWKDHHRIKKTSSKGGISLNKKTKGSFDLDGERRHSFPVSLQVTADYHQWSGDSPTERKHHGLKKWRDRRASAPVKSSQTIATIVDDKDSDLESISDSCDDSDQSSDYESNEAPAPQVVHMVENSHGRVRKSSLRLPSQTRPRNRKKVSMGSVEVLNDGGKKAVTKRVDFNDTDDQDKEHTNHHGTPGEGIIDPKEMYDSSMKNMSDVMNYLDNARKPSANHDNAPVPSTTSTPVKKPVFKRQQTPLPKKEIEMFSFDDDNDIIPPQPPKLSERKRSSSFSVPAKQNDGGSFFSRLSRPRSSSYKEPKTGEKIGKKSPAKVTDQKKQKSYVTGSVDVFY